MFNELDLAQKQETLRILNALSAEQFADIHAKLTQIYPDSTTIERVSIIKDLLADYHANNGATLDDLQDEGLLDIVASALGLYLTLCRDYIKDGDRLPIEVFKDLVLLQLNDCNGDYVWLNRIRTNLRNISYISEACELADTPNATTALFISVINAAFDFLIDC